MKCLALLLAKIRENPEKAQGQVGSSGKVNVAAVNSLFQSSPRFHRCSVEICGAVMRHKSGRGSRPVGPGHIAGASGQDGAIVGELGTS